MDAVILAGGKGSRMDDALPKALVNAKGKPIISYHLDYLSRFDTVRHFILALGHKADMIADYVKENHHGLDVALSVEAKPLGTAGALKKALSYSLSQTVLALNCDDITDINVPRLGLRTENTICVAHPPLPFGRVAIENGYVKQFEEKPLYPSWVSCGWYLFNRDDILDALPNSGSLEYDVFPRIRLAAFPHTGFWKPLNSKKDIEEFDRMPLPGALR